MMTEKKPEKILIVDDDEYICNIYSKIFKDKGIETETAHTGKQMLEKMKNEEKPEVVVLDLFMPEMDGFEALELAYKEDLLQNSTVIILSNYADQVAQEKAEELGSKKFIVKSTLLPEDIITEVLKTYQEELLIE
ncbi:MAG: response regulator [Patescibacteria group bacterium]